MSHAAVDSEVLFWLAAALSLLLLLVFIVAVLRTPSEAAGWPRPPKPSRPAPVPPPLVRRPPAAVLADAEAGSAAGPQPAPIFRPQVPGGPPWGPAPKPPGPMDRDTVPWPAVRGQTPGNARAYQVLQPDAALVPYRGVTPGQTWSGVRAGAHRKRGRHGAHHAGMSTGRVRVSAGRAGRHRAGAH